MKRLPILTFLTAAMQLLPGQSGCPTDEADLDQDGYSEVDGDCVDYDATIYPGAPEVWNDGIDQDCNGSDYTVRDELFELTQITLPSDDGATLVLDSAGQKYVSTQLYVEFTPEATASVREEAVALVDGTISGQYANYGVWVVMPAAADYDALVEKAATLHAHAAVSAVGLEPLFQASAQLDNDALTATQRWGFDAIGHAAAYDYVEKSGRFGENTAPVVVAVIDTAFDIYHNDLFDNMVVDGSDSSTCQPRDFGNGDLEVNPDPDQTYGVAHGTETASIIGGVNGNGGMNGVVPHIRLCPLKVGKTGWAIYYGEPTAAAITAAIEYATQTGVDIISLSVNTHGGSVFQDYNVRQVRRAVEDAMAAGIIVVSSLGNDGIESSNSYPGAIEGVIGVGATGKTGGRWEEEGFSSNYGTHLDVAAPGEDIYAAYSNPAEAGVDYTTSSGTSLSAPFVSGLAALVMQARPDLVWTPQSMQQHLQDTADLQEVTLPDGSTVMWPVINAEAAVSALLRPAVPYVVYPSDGQTEVDHEGMTLEWGISDNNADEIVYDVYLGPQADNMRWLGRTDPGVTTYTNYTPSDGVTYYWQVVAENAAGLRTASAQWTFTAAHYQPEGYGDVALYAEFTIGGVDNYNYLGTSVDMKRDLDGDGTSDLLIGAPGSDLAGDTSGAAYLFYGAWHGETTANQADAIFTGRVDSGAGEDVQMCGDLNGDGYGDVVIGSPDYEGAGQAGVVYVFYGPFAGRYYYTDADAAIYGQAGDQLGRLVRCADLNNDGVHDLVLSSYDRGVSGAGSRAGTVYVFEGPITGSVNSSTADWMYTGDHYENYLGKEVVLNDFNLDGHVDIAISGYHDERGGRDAGAAFIYYGPGFSSGTPDDADAAILGIADVDAGYTMALIPDMNGDRYPELGLGGPYAASGNGAIYIVYGPPTGTRYCSSDDFTITGHDDSSFVARSPFAGSDLNNDGYGDVIIGAENTDNKGEVYVLYGPATSAYTWTSYADLTLLAGSNSAFGSSVSTGDWNGDGYPDIAIGALDTSYNGVYRSGSVLVVLGGKVPPSQ